MLRKPVTENYPEEPVHFQPRYRGIHVLHRDENGLEKCVGCFLCAAACPARCIYIEAAENTDARRISGRRTLYPRLQHRLFSLHFLRLLRGEACPTDAITHGHGFELATSDINALIYRKEKLLEKATAMPKSAHRIIVPVSCKQRIGLRLWLSSYQSPSRPDSAVATSK